MNNPTLNNNLELPSKTESLSKIEQLIDEVSEQCSINEDSYGNMLVALTEAVNNQDRPGYLINRTAEALDVIDRAGHANLKIEYDLYHMQIMEGDLVNTLRENLNRIGNIQFADTPGRHEPGTGEINFPYIFEAIDDMGWEGYLSAEYNPSGRTEDTLSWMPK